MATRRIPLEGAINFRDLGGYPALGGRTTRWNTIYRSDSLAELTESDRRAFATLGIRTVCDFRLSGEVARKPNRLPEGHAIREVAIGFIPEGTLDMLSSIDAGRYDAADIEREVLVHYRKFVRDHTAEYRQLFDAILSEGALPLLMHCTSGKDRTGFAAAAVLKAVGVSRDTIVADYALTNDYRRDISHLFSNRLSPDVVGTLTHANPRYIHAALDEIETAYGSTQDWLAALGVDEQGRNRLVELLTE
jgi:protein-tyrosine phosphatase